MTPEERWIKSEEGGWFHLASREGFYRFDSDSGDLGRGASFETMRFQSEEGREYFIQSDEWKRRLSRAASELQWLKQDIREVQTKSGKISRKRFLALLERCGK